MIAKVVKVIEKNSREKLYEIQDEKGNLYCKTSKEIKNDIHNRSLQLLNYKVTKDNRLVKSQDKYYDYLLLNGNNIVGTFDFKGNLKIFSVKPFDFDTNITEWVYKRAKFSCAHNVKEFFKTIGINTVEDFISMNNCISLHDTFWIKSLNSKLEWKDVSPYRHNYSDVISTYALDGIDLGNVEKNYFSPVVSTNGSFPHTWKFNNGKITFVKAGSKYTLGGSNSGREPYSEYYASVVADYLGFNHVNYSIREHRRRDNRIDIVTDCNCFTTEQTGTVTAYLLGLDSYEKVIEYCKALSTKSFHTILDMLFLDCLLLNTDRHFSNIEFFVDNRTLEVKELTPIFDNNFSFVPRFIEDYDTFDRSEYLVRDNRTFENLYTLVKQYKDYKGKLLSLKKLTLKKPKNVFIKDRRLKFLNDFLQMQVDYLLTL